jgi:hypothetical protein
MHEVKVATTVPLHTPTPTPLPTPAAGAVAADAGPGGGADGDRAVTEEDGIEGGGIAGQYVAKVTIADLDRTAAGAVAGGDERALCAGAMAFSPCGFKVVAELPTADVLAAVLISGGGDGNVDDAHDSHVLLAATGSDAVHDKRTNTLPKERQKAGEQKTNNRKLVSYFSPLPAGLKNDVARELDLLVGVSRFCCSRRLFTPT